MRKLLSPPRVFRNFAFLFENFDFCAKSWPFLLEKFVFVRKVFILCENFAFYVKILPFFSKFCYFIQNFWFWWNTRQNPAGPRGLGGRAGRGGVVYFTSRPTLLGVRQKIFFCWQLRLNLMSFLFFLVSGTRPPGTTKKELKCRPSRNTSRHCPNASPAYLESIIWPRVTQRSVSKISKCVFFVTFLYVFVFGWFVDISR